LFFISKATLRWQTPILFANRRLLFVGSHQGVVGGSGGREDIRGGRQPPRYCSRRRDGEGPTSWYVWWL